MINNPLIAQGTLLNTLQWTAWEKDIRKKKQTGVTDVKNKHMVTSG